MTQAFNSKFNINTNDVANKPKMNDNKNNNNNNHNDNHDEKNKSDNNSNAVSSSTDSSTTSINTKVSNDNIHKNTGANVAPLKKDENYNHKMKEMLLQLDKMVQGCFDNDELVQIECCKRIRKLLSVEKNPAVEEVVNSGVVPRIIEFLGNKYKNNPKLQFEAAWILTNVASTNTGNTQLVMKNNDAVPHLVNLMLSNNRDVAEQATWALGNIAGDSPHCRDIVLASGALINLQKLLNRCIGVLNSTAAQNGWRFEQLLQDPKMLALIVLLRNVTWTLSNFCRGKPEPDKKYIKDTIEALTVMLTLPDTEILQDAVWGFSYLTEIEGGDHDHDDDRKHNENVLL